MPSYTFHQNNSGGKFIGPHEVTVQAASAEEANQLAKLQGVYFYGISKGIDCACCGNRWEPVHQWDAWNPALGEDE